jgi:type IV pilus assembly protein PilV
MIRHRGLLHAARDRAHSPGRAQRGMTLVEVLVTLVLVSVGLLGVAALQLTTLKDNKDAYVRSQASALAGDILDRMRANTAAFRAGQYDVTWDQTGTTGTTAGQDLTAWQNAINNLLPGGATVASGAIARNGNIVTVSIRWSERTDAATFAATNNALETPTFQTRSEI